MEVSLRPSERKIKNICVIHEGFAHYSKRKHAEKWEYKYTRRRNNKQPITKRKHEAFSSRPKLIETGKGILTGVFFLFNI